MTSANHILAGINSAAETAVEDGLSFPVPQHSGSRRPSGSSIALSSGGDEYHPSTVRGLKSSDLPARPLTHRHHLSNKAEGSIAYFKVMSKGGVRMDHYRPSVLDIIASSEGLDGMDKKWTKPRDLGGVVMPDFRWVHLPGNDPEWIKNAIYHVLNTVVKAKDDTWMQQESFAREALDEILCDGYWSDHRNIGPADIAHARSMKPFCRKFRTAARSAPKTGANEHLVFLMPYIHWEDGNGYKSMRKVVDGAGDTISQNSQGACDASELLYQSLQGGKPQHIRRTLDQSYYATLRDTARRDEDQVVQRYAKDVLKIEEGECPMLMVDQCWLWIIGKDTIVTAFPRRWARSRTPTSTKDRTDILDGIFEFLAERMNRDKVKSAEVLAHLIIDRCASSVLDCASFDNPDLQFLRFFEESIDQLMVDQGKSLENLWKDVKNSETELIDDSMFRMTEDFKTLESIKDIMEELTMLTRVMRHQRRALDLLTREEVSQPRSRIFDYAESHRGSHSPHHDHRRRQTDEGIAELLVRQEASPSVHSQAHSDPIAGAVNQSAQQGRNLAVQPVLLSETLEELLFRAKERETGLAYLSEKATSTYRALHHLLDLKQRQANLSEAQSARRSAHEMEAQSNSIMLFTVVTILFLPLSSLASIFGINAVEFGQGTVTLRRIFLYLFPISAFVVAVTFLLAFNHNIRRVMLLWIEIAGTTVFLWFPTPKVNAYVKTLQTKLHDLHEGKTSTHHKKAQKRKEDRERKEAKKKQTSPSSPDSLDGTLAAKEKGRKRISDEERLDPAP